LLASIPWIPLPADIDFEHAEAAYECGMLAIRIPKTEEA
jgi:HSP20 family molecular chaperone IbpA